MQQAWLDGINGECSKNIEKGRKVKRPSQVADKRSAILKSQCAFVSLFRDIWGCVINRANKVFL